MSLSLHMQVLVPETYLLKLSHRQVFAMIVYRLTLHPLSHYPGPLIGIVTDWYSVYHAYQGDRHSNFYYLHQQYGSFPQCNLSGVS